MKIMFVLSYQFKENDKDPAALSAEVAESKTPLKEPKHQIEHL
jgi:hypothetical protein